MFIQMQQPSNWTIGNFVLVLVIQQIDLGLGYDTHKQCSKEIDGWANESEENEEFASVEFAGGCVESGEVGEGG